MQKAVDSELLIKSRHLVYFRLTFAFISLVVCICTRWFTHQATSQLGLLATIVFATAYSATALLFITKNILKEDKAVKWLNGILLGLDITCLSILVHLTGGIDSDLYFLYLLPIFLASHIFARRGIFITAFAASFSYVTVLLIENWSFLPYIFSVGEDPGLVGAYIQRLYIFIASRSAMLICVAFVWGAFCEYMSEIAQQGALKLRGQLDANKQLVKETQAKVTREQLINSISSAIRSTLELNQILSTTVSQLGLALNSSRCAIITKSDNLNEPTAIWEALHSGQEHSQQTFFSQRFCQFILNTKSKYEENTINGKIKKVFVLNDPSTDPALAEVAEDLLPLGFLSLVIQPIMYGMESKGVLLIGECKKQRSWDASELELIKYVAGQVAIAIEHARLVDQLSRKNRDLLQKNLHLDAKNLELRTMQSQLIHQEKMASLGRLVAGIAHELNNPINFLHGNLPYLNQYFNELKALISTIDKIPSTHRQKLDELKQKLNYDFLVTDLSNILADLSEGTERIREIIRNLRSFSRIDEAELKEASVQEGIESTLKLLSQYYGQDKIHVETYFQSLPALLCYPGKLNQVWMNLLSNAAEALVNVKEPRVTISTELSDNWVVVSIGDNGTGIKVADQSKIFEPFYTTKPVGQGTGLGLSICHSIIERHGGTIWFENALPPNQGTTFRVKIPLIASKYDIEADTKAVSEA